MKLTDREWRDFELSGENGIFKNFHGKRLVKKNRLEGLTPLLTAGESNQGVAQFISNPEMKKFSDCISIDMFGTAFYHDYTCCGDDNIYFFVNPEISKEAKLFIVNTINNNKSKYSYGKQFRQANADTTRVMLPVKKDDAGKPDFKFMEDYIIQQIKDKKKIYHSYVTQQLESLTYREIELLEEKKWEEFFLVDIFPSIQRGKRLTKANQNTGLSPYISSTALNNGVDNYISNTQGVRRFKDCLTIANSGSVGSTFYQPFEFVASDHVTHLKNDSMNKYIYLFIATLTCRLSEKYNFNREINDKRMSREKIILPINEEGKPDFEYMEQYSKNMILKKYQQYQKHQH